MATTDRFIENIFIISNSGKPLTTYGMFDDNVDPYKTFSETEEAEFIDTSTEANNWLGYHHF